MTESKIDVVIVGAGFAGLYMLHRARGLGLKARIVEAAPGVGGTWYWNCYPGARCDVESMEYSYQFSDELQQEWNWTERYAAQDEILRYANHVADRFDLRRDIQFETRVTAAHFDETARRWVVTTDKGDRFDARHIVMATGCLSTPNTPHIAGQETFAGRIFHTGTWPHEKISFAGRRVGVIGTGSSGIQAIPVIAQDAKHVTVFQRTANYTIPAHNRPLTREEIAAVKADYAGLRARANALPSGVYAEVNPKGAMDASPEERRATYEKAWNHGGTVFMAAFSDLVMSHASNETAAEFVREKIRAIVKDPKVADLLSPRNVIGCKRLCIDTDYYATYNRPNVSLVDVSGTPIEAITPTGLRSGGRDHVFDDLVYATGFDAMTGTLNAIDIRGRGGRRLREKWKDVPHNYLGLMVAGFPNLYTITGPGSPSVFTNMIPAIEQHVNWIVDLLAHMGGAGKDCVEATEGAERDWIKHVAEVGALSLRSHCDSWYLGANIEGKARVFTPYIGGVPTYAKICDDVAAKGYEGFTLS